MTRVFVGGFQHETNTFGPSLADWSAFTSGSTFPPALRGPDMLTFFAGVNAPISGFAARAQELGWTLWPSLWAGASPSSYVTREAYEHIAQTLVDDLSQALKEGIDAIYLDLHGAAVAQHVADAEGELLRRLRSLAGDIPLVASLDLHANVTPAMLQHADALTCYRSYPHVDMAATGARAADLLQRRLQLGRRQALAVAHLDYLIPLPAQSTWNEPAASIYAPMSDWDQAHQASVNFCMGFPAADFDGCRPCLWAYADTAADAQAALAALRLLADQPQQWQLQLASADEAVALALQSAGQASAPVVIADTEDNSGAGADSNTTGMLHALLRAQAGRAHPRRVVVGMVYDPEAAQSAHAAGVGQTISASLGASVPTYQGRSDDPVFGPYTVCALSDGQITLKGPMMTGLKTQFGPSACLEKDGVLVAVVSRKAQLLDREMLRMVGVDAEAMAIVVVKSSNHFRADFTPIASRIVVAKANGPMAADPADLAWQHLSPEVRVRP